MKSNANPHREVEYQNEIDLKELFNIFWRGKKLIIIFSLFMAMVGVLVALSLPNVYKSEALLAPAEKQSGESLGALAGQFGGLASLAGVNLTGGTNTRLTLALELLKSRVFIGEFVERHKLKPVIMASEGWERSSNKVLFDDDVYNESKGLWVRDVNPPYKPEPSIQEVHEKFIEENLVIQKDEETGFIRLAVRHHSPELAFKIVMLLVGDINREIREKDILEAKQSIEYLEEALQETSVADMQEVFYQLIEQQQQTKMLATVQSEYVLKVIDPPLVAEEKDEPRRAVLVIVAGISGTLLSMFFLLFRNFFKEDK